MSGSDQRPPARPSDPRLTDPRLAGHAPTRGAPSPGRPGEGVSDPDELARIIALLRDSEAARGPRRADVQIGEFVVAGNRVPLPYVAGLQGLTRTEAAVIRFLGWGRSNADIAVLLGMTENTVRTHLNNAVGKLSADGMRHLNSIAGLLFHPVE